MSQSTCTSRRDIAVAGATDSPELYGQEAVYVARMLLVDDAKASSELFAASLKAELDVVVDCVFEVSAVTPALVSAVDYEVALVDLSFPGQGLTSGADALMVLHRHAPGTLLVVLTQGDGSVTDLLRDVWDVFPLAGVLSKAGSLSEQLESIGRILYGTHPIVDSILRMYLPEQRSPWRTLEGFGRLVPHAGHAKVWRALIESPTEPSYNELAARTGLAVNSIRNYRSQLVPELRLHGLIEPSLREMHAFGRRCRPFLWPHIVRRLG